MKNEVLDVEKITGKSLEELFEFYKKKLVKATIYKYYSRYLKGIWIDDIFSCAEIGLYKGLMKIDKSRIKNDVSISAALVWAMRAEVKKFEREIFGSENSIKRKQIYNTISYNNTVGDNSFNDRSYEEYITEAAIGDVNKEYSEIDKKIEYLDLYNVIKELNEDEKYLVGRLMNNITLETIGEEMNISKDKVFRMKQKLLKKLKIKLEIKISL